MVIEKKKKISKVWIIGAILIILHFYKLPFYYSQPGDAKELAPYVEVEGGYKEEQGSFMLTTVLMGQTNVYFYAWAHFSEFRDIYPEDQVKRPEETEEDYHHRQQMMMNTSQDAAKIAAYNFAGKDIDISYNGIMITSFIEGMSGEKYLTYEDRILKVDGYRVQTVNELNQRLAGKELGDEVILTVMRNKEEVDLTVPLSLFPDDIDGGEGRVGIGIMYPVTDRTLAFDPEVTIDVRNIGGPSAGFMFSLEVLNQLTPEDLTKGYHISGTGTIDEEGNVGRIGGAKQKVVAAHKAGSDIFFVPREGGREDSNYEEALATAKEIKTTTKIVGVDTIAEAVEYLEQLERQD
ncbi:SepM family pheromone-processing serine protease [Alkalihalobacterium alkalinitrilicum]|uniref:SepM family pheromone-processing serine protease n=1 Tax=Alkalihalobacterium alkalinitrilicum TaxID=427920 RepID=UPI0009959C2B|nr:SepM family pheromone-processing serine protease [Alkalihalobacterium alkalinitrilicum]